MPAAAGWILAKGLLLAAGILGTGAGLSGAPPRPGKVPPPAAPAAPSEYDLGLKAYQEGRFEEAIRYFSTAVPKMPANNAVFHFLGASYVRLGQYDTGIAALIRANAFKEEANTYDWLGLAYRSQGNFSESARCYQKALAMAPDNPTLYYGLGVASYWLGWLPESLQAVEMGLQKASDPREKQGLFELQSWLYGSRGMYPEVYGLVGETRQLGVLVDRHESGLQIARMMRGFPAEMAGLKPGDILIALNGTPIPSSLPEFLAKVLATAPFGSKALIRYLRAGQEYETDLIVGVPPNFAALAKTTSGPRPAGGGPFLKISRLAIVPLPVEAGQRFDLELDYAGVCQNAGTEAGEVQFRFTILEGERVVHAERPVSLGPATGSRQTRVHHLTAAKKPGSYQIRVGLSCLDLNAENSVDFAIR